MKKFLKAGAASLVLLAAAASSQAALVQMYNTNLTGGNLSSVTQAQGVISAAAGPDFSTYDNTINYSGDTFPGSAFGAPPNDVFVMRVTGTIDTALYSSLSMLHDDGFVIRINGSNFFQFNGNTAPATTSSGALANMGVVSFEMIFWDQGGQQVAQLSGFNRTIGGSGLAVIGNPVSAPGTIALAGFGLALMGASMRRRAV